MRTACADQQSISYLPSRMPYTIWLPVLKIVIHLRATSCTCKPIVNILRVGHEDEALPIPLAIECKSLHVTESVQSLLHNSSLDAVRERGEGREKLGDAALERLPELVHCVLGVHGCDREAVTERCRNEIPWLRSATSNQK